MSASHADLLVELGTEELPPRSLRQLSEAFGEHLQEALDQLQLRGAGSQLQLFASPRRLAVLVTEVARNQADRVVERRGPAVNAAYAADGQPTRAAEGFAGSCGVTVAELERQVTDKGEWLVYRSTESGKPAAELIPAAIDEALRRLPIPKRMRWADLDAEFVRPVHWLVVLHGDDVVPATLLNTAAGRDSRGHRFHHPDAISLAHPGDYADRLETQGRVCADFAERRRRIVEQVERLASEAGGRAVIDTDLLDEVTALVEWPAAMTGRFDEDFLAVPPEALISAMQDHQKYFPVVDDAGAMLPRFIFVANIESSRAASVVAGNERVLRARFSDARFYWDSDRKRPLDDHVEALKTVVFHNRLGSMHERMQRVRTLAGHIAGLIGADAGQAERAAMLAKADLLTGMVYEFPDLQGVMGRYYALAQGEPAGVADAIREQYLPRQAGDTLPGGGIGQALAIADRLDSLAGIFSIGELPTGDKDPFGLRRAALAILRMMIELRLDLDLRDLVERAIAAYGRSGEDTGPLCDQVFDYVLERLQAYYQDRGHSLPQIASVLQQRPARPLDFDARLKAVTSFAGLPEAEALSAANKRIRNILRKTDEAIPQQVDTALLLEPAEQELHRQITSLAAEVEPLFEQSDYTTALTRLAALRPAVDTFFDQVMVMDENQELRRNRLALLNRLSELFLRTADLSLLQ